MLRATQRGLEGRWRPQSGLHTRGERCAASGLAESMRPSYCQLQLCLQQQHQNRVTAETQQAAAREATCGAASERAADGRESRECWATVAVEVMRCCQHLAGDHRQLHRHPTHPSLQTQTQTQVQTQSSLQAQGLHWAGIRWPAWPASAATQRTTAQAPDSACPRQQQAEAGPRHCCCQRQIQSRLQVELAPVQVPLRRAKQPPLQPQQVAAAPE